MNTKRKTPTNPTKPPFPEETMKALEQLGLVLKSIYLEMRKEGYHMIDGKLIKPDQHENE